MTEPLIQQETIKYKTYVKEALVGATKLVFAAHPDPIINEHTKVGIDFPLDKAQYPAVVIRFYERSIKNAGVGHREEFTDINNSDAYVRFKHYLYEGDIEFAIYALSSMDRDLIADSLVQMLTMSTMETYTNYFYQRIYNPPSIPSENEGGAYDPANDHMIDLNTDQINGFGESQTLAPWLPEDVLVYQSSYRIGIHGQFYSRTPVAFNYGLVTAAEEYPYNPTDGDPVPNPNPSDPAPWESFLP